MKENFKESCNELFVNENNTIIVKKELACLLGLNEAIVLNQVRYWIDINEKARKNFKDGKYWCYNTYDEWKMNNFPFWSTRTISRTFLTLEKLGILISENYNKLQIDRTKWYTIDWKKLDELKRNSPLGQKCVSKDTNECIETTTLSCALPKNTSKNTPMTTTENKIKGFSSLENEEDATLKDNKGFSSEKTGTPSKDEITNMMIDKAIKNLGCSEDDITETVKEVIQYYYSKYKDKVGKEHPIINQIAMNSVVDKLILGTDIITWFDFETYESMIDKHFETDYRNCDFNICHFISCDEIRNNRFYETCY